MSCIYCNCMTCLIAKNEYARHGNYPQALANRSQMPVNGPQPQSTQPQSTYHPTGPTNQFVNDDYDRRISALESKLDEKMKDAREFNRKFRESQDSEILKCQLRIADLEQSEEMTRAKFGRMCRCDDRPDLLAHGIHHNNCPLAMKIKVGE